MTSAATRAHVPARVATAADTSARAMEDDSAPIKQSMPITPAFNIAVAFMIRNSPGDRCGTFRLSRVGSTTCGDTGPAGPVAARGRVVSVAHRLHQPEPARTLGRSRGRLGHNLARS